MPLQSEITDLVDDAQETLGLTASGALDGPDRALIAILAALAAIETRLAAIEANTT